MKNTISLLFCLLIANVFAQKEVCYYKDYNWSSIPLSYELTEDQKSEPELVLFEKRSTQIMNNEQGELVEYRLLHTIRRLNSDGAIEDNNKYYVSNYTADQLVFQKARAIQPDGSIIEVSNKDIKESLDDEGNVEFQYFAFEGIQIGSIIEFLQLVKFPPLLTGTYFQVQDDVPKLEGHYDLITPKYLEYEIFTVNGLEKMKSDSTKIDIKRYFLDLKNIAPLRKETSSSYRANLQKIYFKLNKNTSAGKANFFTYQNASKILYDSKFKSLSKKELKKIEGLLEDAEIKAGDSDIDKIRKIEKIVKKEFIIFEGLELAQFSEIENIFKDKIASQDGAIIILLNMFRQAKIPFELVYTTDRTNNKFYTEYEAYNFLEEPLFYMSSVKMYLSSNVYSRLGFPPYEYIATKGLFISEEMIGSIATFKHEIKTISYPSADKSMDIINTNVKFNDNLDEVKIDVERITTGYKAYFYQAYMDYLDDERKLESQKEYLNYIDRDAEIKDLKFENADTDLMGIEPYIGEGKITSENFTENAGNKVLFKVGLLIGPQAEMYNEKERKIDVETEFTREYKREIIFEIPENYVLKNPEILTMETVPALPNQPIGFVSSYVLEGNQVKVTIREWYNEIYFPLSAYEDYKSVINAAADFNKLVLVFEPKN